MLYISDRASLRALAGAFNWGASHHGNQHSADSATAAHNAAPQQSRSNGQTQMPYTISTRRSTKVFLYIQCFFKCPCYGFKLEDVITCQR